jgi:hypothetical protein
MDANPAALAALAEWSNDPRPSFEGTFAVENDAAPGGGAFSRLGRVGSASFP